MPLGFFNDGPKNFGGRDSAGLCGTNILLSVKLTARKVPPLVTATPVSWVTAGYLIA